VKTYLHGERLLIRSWARAQMSMDDLARLNQRAVDLGVRGGVLGGGRPFVWTAGVYSGSLRAEATGRTALEALEAAMDRYEAQPFTVEELVTIASQSGMDVRRV
jgi:hypothetical protein